MAQPSTTPVAVPVTPTTLGSFRSVALYILDFIADSAQVLAARFVVLVLLSLVTQFVVYATCRVAHAMQYVATDAVITILFIYTFLSLAALAFGDMLRVAGLLTLVDVIRDLTTKGRNVLELHSDRTLRVDLDMPETKSLRTVMFGIRIVFKIILFTIINSLVIALLIYRHELANAIFSNVPIVGVDHKLVVVICIFILFAMWMLKPTQEKGSKK